MTVEEQIRQLSGRLQRLEILHKRNTAEIESLHQQIRKLQDSLQDLTTSEPVTEAFNDELPEDEFVPTKQNLPEETLATSDRTASTAESPAATAARAAAKERQTSLEQYIGGNLINKVGILILIFGIGYLVKHAIDNGFFPPLVRLTLSFAAGLALVLIGYYLKPKYKTYSAVLFSGGMTVLYFTAYGGYAFFNPVLLPQQTSFILMAIFTIVTVVAATLYDLQIIGSLGLVGAYAVPFLMGDPDGDYRLLLSYVAVINTGVLALSLRKLWKGLIIMAFIFSWLIFSFWWATASVFPADTNEAWLFTVLYFILFYASLIGYNLLNKKPFSIWSIILLFLNAFIFFGLGMAILGDTGKEHLQGMFALGNALVHLSLSAWMYYKVPDKKLFYVLAGLFWTFLTITIPVQFEGDTVQILWMAEAVILFYIARKYIISLYEILAYIVLAISCIALFDNWFAHYYDSNIQLGFLFNPHFLTTFLTLGGLSLINQINAKKQMVEKEYAFSMYLPNIVLPALLIVLLYFTFYNEIFHFFDQKFWNSELNGTRDEALLNFQQIWLINYSFAFLAITGLINSLHWKNPILNTLMTGLGVLCIVVFLMAGLWQLNDLRELYLEGYEASHSGYIWIRYISYAFLAVFLLVLNRSLEILAIEPITRYFPLLIHFLILVVLSNELTTVMQLSMGIEMESLALQVGYSILWGVYALILIGLGFRKKSSILRIAAIVLFALTLIKVFFVDLENISTVSKMVLFIALGVLLLIISYLYQRYKDVLLGEDQK